MESKRVKAWTKGTSFSEPENQKLRKNTNKKKAPFWVRFPDPKWGTGERIWYIIGIEDPYVSDPKNGVGFFIFFLNLQ